MLSSRAPRHRGGRGVGVALSATVILGGDGGAFAPGGDPAAAGADAHWAVVGCSPEPSRNSQQIARLLRRHGFRVIPVNPAVDELLGERCYPSVTAIPSAEGVEVVDIFRRADQAGAHVDEAVRIGARAVWMQLGVIDEAAAGRALVAGARSEPAHGAASRRRSTPA